MRVFRKAQAMALVCIVGILVGSAFAPVRGSVAARHFAIEIDASTSGSGSAGTGSIAVAAFFDSTTSTGAGGFSGKLVQPVLGGLDQFGVFSLTVATPPMPVLPCGPAGEVGASGTIISGSFQAQQVVVFGCVGTGVVEGFQIVDRKSGSIIAYDGIGIGDGVNLAQPILAGAVLAGNTAGAGSVGAGTADVAEVIAVKADGGVVGSGAAEAFMAGLSYEMRFGISGVSFQVGCTIVLSGVINGGSFLGQPVTTNLTLTTCPSTSSSPQLVTVTVVVGPALNPIYAGHGSGLAAIAIPNLIEA